MTRLRRSIPLGSPIGVANGTRVFHGPIYTKLLPSLPTRSEFRRLRAVWYRGSSRLNSRPAGDSCRSLAKLLELALFIAHGRLALSISIVFHGLSEPNPEYPSCEQDCCSPPLPPPRCCRSPLRCPPKPRRRPRRKHPPAYGRRWTTTPSSRTAGYYFTNQT